MRARYFVTVAALLTATAGCGEYRNSTFVPPAQTPDAQSQHAASTMATTAAVATPAPTPTPIVLSPGKTVGLDNQFTPNDGDTTRGGRGQTVDGLPCKTSMSENNYHVHWYLGLLVNGRQIAIPDGVGMNNPGPDTTFNGHPNYTNTASCFYYLHTHDASGMMHTESPSTAPLSSSLYTLGTLLDVWGMTLSSSGFGPYSGTTRVYTAKVPLKTLTASNYTLYTGTTPRAISVYSHMAIWIEVGPTFVAPPNIPAVKFFTEY